MKQVIALFIGVASSIRLGDAPPYYPGPTWTYNHPSAAGFLQTSACVDAGLGGVTCGPSDTQLFATGMNGDEDLGQDITMKGEKFHYAQGQNLAQSEWTPVEVKQDPTLLPFCHGNNGAPGVNCKVPACTGTNGPLDGPTGTPCTREEPAAVPHYNTDPTAGRPYATSGDLTHSDPSPPVPAQIVVQLSQDDAAAAAPAAAAGAAAPAAAAAVPPPEKVSILDPKIAKTHTSFYGQQ